MPNLKLEDSINKIYDKSGYLDKYGGSVAITVVVLLVFTTVFGYYYTIANARALKKDWTKIRCDPMVMPFAGLINAPPEGSKWDYTTKNFNYCLNDVLKDITKAETAGLHATESVMHSVVGGLSNAVQSIRSLLSRIRNIVGELTSTIFGKIFNVLVPLRIMLIRSLDVMNKTQGVAVTGLFTGLAGILSVNSFFWMFIIAVGIFLALLIASILLELLIPLFGFIAALITTAFLVAILVIFLPVLIVIVDIATLSSTIPKQSSGQPQALCFDGSTLIGVKEKGNIKIKDVKLNDVLSDGGRVTAKFKLAMHKQTMYSINGVKVTGNHMMDDDEYGFIEVRHHPLSMKVKGYREPFIYCLNTTTKNIVIAGLKFLDWDELDDGDITALQEKSAKHLPRCFSLGDIHEHLECGLHGDTQIELDDGRSVNLKDVQVNDQLRFGQRVLGVVEMDGSNVGILKEYKFGGATFIGSPNLRIYSKDLGVISALDMPGVPVKSRQKLYNVITDTKFIVINGIRFFDYNGGLEPLLWKKMLNNQQNDL